MLEGFLIALVLCVLWSIPFFKFIIKFLLTIMVGLVAYYIIGDTWSSMGTGLFLFLLALCILIASTLVYLYARLQRWYFTKYPERKPSGLNW